jgi:ABC-type nitrate/sulfonate/bicarbonate transport system substrate-binding protein
MSTSTLEPNPQVHAPSAKQLTDAYYTICPVFVASNIAVELGWLDEEFKRVGAKATYLRSLANNAGWIPHYTHGLDNLFRDGGAIPTIRARADLTSTKLIGLTWSQTGGHILVRSDSGIHRVADLKGRKFGIVTSLNKNKIDFHRATAHRGILLALQLAGLTEKDVPLVDINDADDPKFLPAQRPSEFWSQSKAHRTNPKIAEDLIALKEGRVHAIYANPGRSDSLVKSGEYTVIEDLAQYPDWTVQVANGPYTNAVNAGFAQEHPEVVVAFLRASVRAGRWANRNRRAAAEIFKRVTYYDNVKLIEEQIAHVDFVPQLSPKNIAAIEIQKNFLRDHGYVTNDFAVGSDWADASYLEEAISSLPKED